MLLRSKLALCGTVILLASCQPGQSAETATPAAVIDTYIGIAEASYGDSLSSARELDLAIADLLAEPGEQTLQQAREAWRAARVPYMQTEVFRFGNPVVDAWEGRVNAWPLDEGLIDYTAPQYGEESANNYFYNANIIANETLSIGGIEVDARQISPQLLSGTLHQIDGVEANVATGYHAIEFLLWGQDLHGTEPGSGERPYTDYSLEDCSNGNCDRRRDYLQSASELLLTDLEEMVQSWQPGGAAREDLLSRGERGALASILTGMGSLAYGELAGERTRLALLLQDPEEEHDCFSDNTHYSHYYDVQGIRNVYYGEYQGLDGNGVQGPGIDALVQAADPQVAQVMREALEEAEAAMAALVEQARMGQPFDVLIGFGNEQGDAVLGRVVDGLVATTRAIESVISALQLDSVSIQGSDSLDAPAQVL